MKIIDAFKMAWVGFAEQMRWNYSIKLSNGCSFTRKGFKHDVESGIYMFKDGANSYKFKVGKKK